MASQSAVFKMIFAFIAFLPACSGIRGGAECESVAGIVAVGVGIEDALRLMEGYGNGGPLLAMVAPDPSEDLKHWSVDQGVLVASYSLETKKITGLSFHLSDERPKAERMYFDYEVACFAPREKRLTLQTAGPEQVGE